MQPSKEQMKKICGGQEATIEKIGLWKFTNSMIKIYGALCLDCKLRIRRQPKMGLDKYCDKCRPIAEQTIKELLQ